MSWRFGLHWERDPPAAEPAAGMGGRPVTAPASPSIPSSR